MTLRLTNPNTGRTIFFPSSRLTYEQANEGTPYEIASGEDGLDGVRQVQFSFGGDATVTLIDNGIAEMIEVRNFLREETVVDALTHEYGLIENCLIGSVRIATGSNSSRTYSLQFRQFVIATAKDILLAPRQQRAVTPSGADDVGKQATTEDTEVGSEQKKTAFKTLFDFGVSLVSGE